MIKTIRSIFDSLEPTLSPSEEERYRRAYYHVDMHQLRILMVITISISFFWFFKELLFYEHKAVLALMQVLRGIYIAAGIYFLARERDNKSHLINRGRFLIFALLFIVHQSLIFTTRPADYAFSSYMSLLIVLIVYFTFPLGLAGRTGIAFILTFAEIASTILAKQYHRGGMVTVVVTFVVLNAICLSYSASINTTRRNNFRQLAGKEILLAEVHHRIKNNIAAIGAMLKLQSDLAHDSAAAAILKDALGRVESMRAVYDKLQPDDGYRSISVKRYLEDLTSSILHIFPEAGRVRLNSRIDDIMIDVKTMVLIGSVVNELITNSMKYAFSGGHGGTITLDVTRKANILTVTYHDDGAGFPEGFDPSASAGLGFMIIQMVVEQLNGTLKYINTGGRGVGCEICFEG